MAIATAAAGILTGSGSFASIGRGSLQRQANIMQLEVTAAAVTHVNTQPFIPLRRAQQNKVTQVDTCQVSCAILTNDYRYRYRRGLQPACTVTLFQ